MKRNQIKLPRAVKILALIAGFSIFIGTMIYIQYEEKREEEYWRQKIGEEQIDENKSLISIVSGSGYTSEALSQGELYMSNDELLEKWESTAYHTTETFITIDLNENLEATTDIYLLRFKMRASDSASEINVDFGGTQNYYLTTSWNEYYYPCTEGKIDSIKWSLEPEAQGVELSDIEVWKGSKESVNLQDVKCGTYLLEQYDFIELKETGTGFGYKNTDLQYRDGYLFSIGGGTLFIGEEAEDGTIRTLGHLDGLGDVRHIEVRDDKTVAIASRLNGIYLVDVSDKEVPVLLAHYDTLEIANDICFAGNYMIVAGRYFGVEIVDITNLQGPEFVTKIVNSKECYRVAVDGNNLYISCWARGNVDVYDISHINNPQYVSTLDVDGRCGEVYVDGGYIYVVTGYRAMSNYENIGDSGYGTGNGLAIFDMSNPLKPSWCSTVKTEGSLLHYSYDDWSVQVSNGYAYFTNSYGGVYIYNVENPYSPVRTAHVTVPMYRDKGGHYADMSTDERYVFPYDASEYLVSPVTGIAVGKGKIYFTCPMSDLYVWEFKEASPTERFELGGEYSLEEKEVENTYPNVDYFLTEFDVHAIAEYDDDYIIGTDKGILLVNKEFEIISQMETRNPVKDVKINKNCLVTAETEGVGIYELDGDVINPKGFYVSEIENKNVSSVAITDDGNYVIAQAAFAKAEAISIADKMNPTRVTTFIDSDGNSEVTLDQIGGTGSLYYRNIVDSDLTDIIGVIGMNNSIWFKSVGDDLQIVRSYKNSLYREEGGTAYIDREGTALSICHNGYKVYNPITEREDILEDLETYGVLDEAIAGKPMVEGNILVVCNEYKGLIWIIDITNIKVPNLKGFYEITGNPDLGVISDEYILIPTRHSGVMKIRINDYI